MLACVGKEEQVEVCGGETSVGPLAAGGVEGGTSLGQGL